MMMNACAPGVAVVNTDNGFGAAPRSRCSEEQLHAVQQPQSGEPKKQRPRACDQTGRGDGLRRAESVGDDVLDETAAAAARRSRRRGRRDIEPAGAAAESPPLSELSESTDAGMKRRVRRSANAICVRAKEEHARCAPARKGCFRSLGRSELPACLHIRA